MKEQPKSREEVNFRLAVIDALTEWAESKDRMTVPRESFTDVSVLAYGKFKEVGVSGEAPKPDLQLPNVKKRLTFDDKTGELIDADAPKLPETKIEIMHLWMRCQMAEQERKEWMEASERWRLDYERVLASSEKLTELEENFVEKLSGEAKTPDQTPVTDGDKDKAVREFTEMTSKHIMTFFYLMGLKSHIESMVVNQANGEEFIFSFQTVEYFKQRNKTELTSGSVPTPDQIEKLGKDYEAKCLNTQSNIGADARSFSDGYEKAIRESRTWPTPSDEEIALAAEIEFPTIDPDGQGVPHNRRVFTKGAKWVKEWLISSTEQGKTVN